ncbi:hypothetical protein BB558_004064 [Smittium angustum]|uniref:PUA domain-containing protein n=1 Tax=Smittium angustum TaxID=133377 RepID=A0A2U1IZ21_SMIAN|nr:hypothetical protein BB558_005945 [Smittium angustum]PVZ99909.1 hypothetical protein BB558_004064 [Smittium angustum]
MDIKPEVLVKSNTKDHVKFETKSKSHQSDQFNKNPTPDVNQPGSKLSKSSKNHNGSTPKLSSRSNSRSRPTSPSKHLQKQLTVVLKIGTSSVCDPITHVPLLSTLFAIVEVINKLRQMGHRVVLVSSGAVGIGLRRLDIQNKPKELAKLQAVAAVGQGRLMALWDNMFGHLDQPIAQVLLTRNDLSHPTQYINAYNTFVELLDMGVIPIVNENDTVSVGEIRFGDNDTLSAITAGMIHADYLFLLTDVDCLYTDNPRNNPDAKRVLCVDNMSTLIGSVDASTSGSSVGTGGMATKLVAAELAMAAGVTTIITHSNKPAKIIDIIEYFTIPENMKISENIPESVLCTRFVPMPRSLGDRKWWIKHGMRRAGTIYIDYGAFVAVVKMKKSLFAAGIREVEGHFSASQSVVIAFKTELLPENLREKVTSKIIEVGHGMVNYSSTEISRIKGCKSNTFESILGYCDNEDIIHRGNLAVNIPNGFEYLFA